MDFEIRSKPVAGSENDSLLHNRLNQDQNFKQAVSQDLEDLILSTAQLKRNKIKEKLPDFIEPNCDHRAFRNLFQVETLPFLLKKHFCDDGKLKNLQSQLTSAFMMRFDHFKYLFEEERLDNDKIFSILNQTETCYLSEVKSKEEISLEKFTKTVIATIKTVFDNSSVCNEWKVQERRMTKLQNYMKRKISNVRKRVSKHRSSSLENSNYRSKIGGELFDSGDDTDEILQLFPDQDISEELKRPKELGPTKNEQILKLNKKVIELEQKIADMHKQSLTTRANYLKDLAMLRESLFMCGEYQTEAIIQKYKQALRVQYFDELEGVDPQIIQLLNIKLSMLKKEYEIQLSMKEAKIADLNDKILKFKKLQPQHYQLIDMHIQDVFDSIAIIWPQAYPVWSSLHKAYPKDHFYSLIQEAMLGSGLIDQKTYDKMFLMVHTEIEKAQWQVQEAVEKVKQRITFQDDQINKLKAKMNYDRDQFEQILQRVQEQSHAANAEFAREEILQAQSRFEADRDKLEYRIKLYQKQEERFSQDLVRRQAKIAFFKWRMIAITIKSVQETCQFNFETQTQCKLLSEDIKRAMLAPELTQIMSALKTKDTELESMRKNVKTTERLNFEHRIKINQLMNEIQAQQDRIDQLQTDFKDQSEHLIQVQENSEEYRQKLWATRLKLDQTTSIMKNQIILKEALEEKYCIIPKTEQEKQSDQNTQASVKEALSRISIEMQSKTLLYQIEITEALDKSLYAYKCGSKSDKMVQTKIFGLKKDIQLVATNPKPFREQHVKDDLRFDEACQTDLTNNVLDFLIKGAFNFDALTTSNVLDKVINQSESHDKSDPSPRGSRDRSQLIKKKKKNINQIIEEYFIKQPTVAASNEMNYLVDLFVEFENDFLSYHKGARRLHKVIGSQGKSTQPLLQLPKNVMGKNITSRQSGIHDSDSYIQVGTSRSKMRNSMASRQSGRQGQHQTVTSGHQSVNIDSDEVVRQSLRSSSSKKNQMLFRQESVRSDMQSVRTEKDKIQETESKIIETIKFSEGQTFIAQPVQLTQFNQDITIYELQNESERMQALSIFELYVDLISLLKEMEPGIIRFAIQKLKENCYKDLNTDFMDKMRNLRPDIVPEVFTRLWCRTINVNEAKRRGLILNQIKKEWKQRLQPQGFIKVPQHESEVEDDFKVEENSINVLSQRFNSVNRASDTSWVEFHAEADQAASLLTFAGVEKVQNRPKPKKVDKINIDKLEISENNGVQPQRKIVSLERKVNQSRYDTDPPCQIEQRFMNKLSFGNQEQSEAIQQTKKTKRVRPQTSKLRSKSRQKQNAMNCSNDKPVSGCLITGKTSIFSLPINSYELRDHRSHPKQSIAHQQIQQFKRVMTGNTQSSQKDIQLCSQSTGVKTKRTSKSVCQNNVKKATLLNLPSSTSLFAKNNFQKQEQSPVAQKPESQQLNTFEIEQFTNAPLPLERTYFTDTHRPGSHQTTVRRIIPKPISAKIKQNYTQRVLNQTSKVPSSLSIQKRQEKYNLLNIPSLQQRIEMGKMKDVNSQMSGPIKARPEYMIQDQTTIHGKTIGYGSTTMTGQQDFDSGISEAKHVIGRSNNTSKYQLSRETTETGQFYTNQKNNIETKNQNLDQNGKNRFHDRAQSAHPRNRLDQQNSYEVYGQNLLQEKQIQGNTITYTSRP